MWPRGFANALTEVTTAMAIAVVRARRHVEGPNLVENIHNLSSLARCNASCGCGEQKRSGHPNALRDHRVELWKESVGFAIAPASVLSMLGKFPASQIPKTKVHRLIDHIANLN